MRDTGAITFNACAMADAVASTLAMAEGDFVVARQVAGARVLCADTEAEFEFWWQVRRMLDQERAEA